MIIFWMIMIWAGIEAFQDAEPQARLMSPAVIFARVREAAEIFILLSVTSCAFVSLRVRFPEAQNLLAAAGAVIFYFCGRGLKRRDSFIWMAYVCAFFIASHQVKLAGAVWYSAEIALGVAGVRTVIQGIQKKQLLMPVPAFFSGLPGFLVTLSIIALICSALFVR